MRLRSHSHSRGKVRRQPENFRPGLEVLEDRLPPGSLLLMGGLLSSGLASNLQDANAVALVSGSDLSDQGISPAPQQVLASNEVTLGQDNSQTGSAVAAAVLSPAQSSSTGSSLSSDFASSTTATSAGVTASAPAFALNPALAAAAPAAPGTLGHVTFSQTAGVASQSTTNPPIVPLAPDTAQATGAVPSTISPEARAQVQRQLAALPLSFEANQGQFSSSVQFVAQTNSFNAFLTSGGLVMDLPASTTPGAPDLSETTGHHIPLSQRLAAEPVATGPDTLVQMRLVGGNPAAQAIGQEQLPGKVNYFIGSDPSQWHTNIATFGQVEYQSVYPGIDLSYYGQANQLEYDFVVNPGADPRAVTLAFSGASQTSLDGQGNLVLSTGAGQVVQHKPYAYQVVDGVRQEVASTFVLNDQHQVTFQVGAYDSSRQLVIDPVLKFSTYLGGNNTDRVYGIGLDLAGNVYAVGHTKSTNFPIVGGYQSTYGGGAFDAFVAKLSRNGSTLLYSTFLGGTGDDEGSGIAVDPVSGNAYITGITFSTNYPTTSNAFQPTYGGGGDDFMTEVGAGGNTLVYSTYIGGSGDDEGGGLVGPGIAADSTGKAYVTGYTASTNFPTTSGAYQTTFNPGQAAAAFLTVVDTTLSGQSSKVYSTYIGTTGAADDNEGVGVAVDASGIVYLAGYSDSRSFPTTAGVIQPTNAGHYQNIIMKFDITQSGSAGLLASTYLGGSQGVGTNAPDDSPTGMALDSLGNIYLAGASDTTNYPVTPDAYQTGLAGIAIQDAFLSVLNNNLTALVYSTYLGGSQGTSSGADYAGAVATYTDATGQVYANLAGATVSSDFPTLNSIQSWTGVQDAFVALFKIDTSGSFSSTTVFASILGGSNVLSAGLAAAFGPKGSVLDGGSTGASNFPVTQGAYQTTFGGGDRDGWIAQLT
jgi:hypothetical protein